MYKLRFTLKEIKSLLHRKKNCPHCGNDRLDKEVIKEYEGHKRVSTGQMNLMKEDVYRCILIYNCPVCRRKYTLDGLNTGQAYGQCLDVNCEAKQTELIEDSKVRENKRIKKILRLFFNLCLCVQILILLQIAVTEKQYVILLIAVPFVFIWYLLVCIMLKK